jgi:hypothetical protein
MRRWSVLGILTYLKYVPVPVLRPPSLTPARYASVSLTVVGSPAAALFVFDKALAFNE